jgi:hypothetical protein
MGAAAAAEWNEHCRQGVAGMDGRGSSVGLLPRMPSARAMTLEVTPVCVGEMLQSRDQRCPPPSTFVMMTDDTKPLCPTYSSLEVGGKTCVLQSANTSATTVML